MSDVFQTRERLLARMAGAVLATVFVLLLGRLFQVQVVENSFFKHKASAFHRRVKKEKGLRGTIVDRTGAPLALSTPCRRVVIHPGRVKSIDVAARSLSWACDVPELKIRDELRSGRPYVKLLDRVEDNEMIRRLEGLRLEGVEIEETEKRYYPHGALFSHILGFVGEDNQGLEGIEGKFDGALEGELGALDYEQDGSQHRFFSVGLPDRTPDPGHEIVLAVDTVIQSFLDREVEEAYRHYHPDSVSGVVLNPWDGAVLALANRPNFDSNRFLDSPRETWRNRVVADTYAPGSSFKPVVASLALERGLVSPDETIFCENGRWSYDGRAPLSDTHPHGSLAFRDVIVESSNIGMAKVGLRVGRDALHEGFRRFGFAQKTGIDLPGEAMGTMTRLADWTEKYTTVSVSFGQEIAVTPIQLVTAFAAIANGGYRVKPRIVEKFVSPHGEVTYPVRVEPQRILPLAVCESLRSILEDVVNRGTGKPARIPGYRVAGKTGTAERFVGRHVNGYVSSFCGFAPADQPAVVVLIMLNGVHGAEYFGGTVAAPGVKRVLEDTLLYLGIPPTEVDASPVAWLDSSD
ncbi:MAG: penicillin-binding protein 2 [Planctomycetes bacterium]|nr:penicillin-binding protein 2 [Planctomycetota bacterium]